MVYKHYGVSVFFIFVGMLAYSQQRGSSNLITMPASESYHQSEKYQQRWGKHYRAEWHTPVSFLKVNLDTLAGGLKVYDKGGGRQTKTLRLRDKNGREYVLRSIDKSFGNALPPVTHGTFIEEIANDQVTFSHPYGALIVAPLAEAAGLLHTNPAIFYLPRQPALNDFEWAAETLYLFEQRPDEDWQVADNFGNSKKIIGTETLLENTLESNRHIVDQTAFATARLFDMLIGDWGRHEDQWRWASFENGKTTKYLPVPRDRDNAFSKLDGNWLKPALGMANAKHMQDFDQDIKDVKAFNFPARHLDRRYLNALNLQQWLNAASKLQKAMTDEVIDAAVKKLPPEVYPISGPSIAAKLKSRREHLPKYAKQYFTYLARQVDITGSKASEVLKVEHLTDSTTSVSLFEKGAGNSTKTEPYYRRIFNHAETNEIRLYGIGGADSFSVSGTAPKALTVRFIGGPGKDVYNAGNAAATPSHAVKIYDNKENLFEGKNKFRTHLSGDTSIHHYNHKEFTEAKKGLMPIVFFSQPDRLFVGLRYKNQTPAWRKRPYGQRHIVEARYSIGQKAPNFIYAGSFPLMLGKWEMLLQANYDFIVWTNFYGLGNETKTTTEDRDYNRVRSRQILAKLGAQRVFNNRQRILFSPFYQNYDIINDTSRFLSKTPAYVNSQTFRTKQYAGAEMEYVYQHINDSVLPVKGVSFLIAANFAQNLADKEKQVGRLFGEVNFFLPLTKKLNVYVLAGGSTLAGEPEFFQYNMLASSQTIRGYRRDRFYGTSSFFNQNELRWITDVRAKYYSGKFGLFALYDVGRVWLKGEESNLWHTSYGAGIILSPFNRISVSAAYAISKDDTNINVRLLRAL